MERSLSKDTAGQAIRATIGLIVSENGINTGPSKPIMLASIDCCTELANYNKPKRIVAGSNGQCNSLTAGSICLTACTMTNCHSTFTSIWPC